MDHDMDSPTPALEEARTLASDVVHTPEVMLTAAGNAGEATTAAALSALNDSLSAIRDEMSELRAVVWDSANRHAPQTPKEEATTPEEAPAEEVIPEVVPPPERRVRRGLRKVRRNR